MGSGRTLSLLAKRRTEHLCCRVVMPRYPVRGVPKAPFFLVGLGRTSVHSLRLLGRSIGAWILCSLLLIPPTFGALYPSFGCAAFGNCLAVVSQKATLAYN